MQKKFKTQLFADLCEEYLKIWYAVHLGDDPELHTYKACRRRKIQRVMKMMLKRID